MTPKLAGLLAKVARGYGEACLLELFSVFDLAATMSTLSKVVSVSEELNRLGLRMIPPISQGELDTTRRIIFADPGIITSESVRSELANRESDGMELKSSLLFDHNRAQAQPDAPKSVFKSDKVLHSSLKTIAAFLNSGGGVLIIGVNDGGEIIGITHDYACMTSNPDRQNADGWELILRGYIEGHFKDGISINDYVACAIVELDGLPIARLDVSSRKILSFLKMGDLYALYRRQGNQTVQVSIDLVEEFLEFRREQLS